MFFAEVEWPLMALQRQGAPSRKTVWRRPLSGLSRRLSKFVNFDNATSRSTMSVPRIFVQGYGAQRRICIMPSIELRRLDPSRNMRRFYRLDMQPDRVKARVFEA